MNPFKNLITLLYILFSIFVSISCRKDCEITQIYLDANYYIAPLGNDTNPGTFERPFKTIECAFSKCTGSELIYVRGGIYKVSDKTKYLGFSLKGRKGKDADNRIKIWAYPGEKITLDCSPMIVNNDGIVGLNIEADFLHIRGLEVINLPQNKNSSTGFGYYNVGILIKANYVTLENCTAHDNGGTGIHIGGTSTETYLRNCDSYNNYDPYTSNSDGEPYPGGNADGFHITSWGADTNQKLVGCRAWNNSDDGYDFFGTDGFVLVDSCWAFRNGFLADNTESKGDGSGIKLGITKGFDVLKKTVTHCVAAFNRMEGITQNRGYGIMNVSNNTALGNGSSQFDFANKLSGTQITLSNNIAVGTIWTPHPIQVNNSWTLNITASANDFKSTEISLLKAPRQLSGNLPVNDAFKLKSSSALKGLGAF